MGVNYKELKQGGFMRQRQPNYFSTREIKKCGRTFYVGATLHDSARGGNFREKLHTFDFAAGH